MCISESLHDEFKAYVMVLSLARLFGSRCVSVVLYRSYCSVVENESEHKHEPIRPRMTFKVLVCIHSNRRKAANNALSKRTET